MTEAHYENIPEWAKFILEELRYLGRVIQRMTDDQAHLDSDVQAIVAGISTVEAEIAALKDQPAATALDFSALDAAVARIQADGQPAADPTPAPEPTPAPDAPPAV